VNSSVRRQMSNVRSALNELFCLFIEEAQDEIDRAEVDEAFGIVADDIDMYRHRLFEESEGVE
jgi:hypothetical protein